MRWLKRLGIAVLAVILLSGILGVWVVRRPFPKVSGTVSVDGLTSDVEVIRDSFGVPHIYASTMEDLFLAQGYVHAQDRFWQMDFWRHVGSGRLSELFGADQVETDAFLRTLGWRDLAEREYSNSEGTLREALDSYAQGVNAYLGSSPSLSLEHTILRLQNSAYSPESWTPPDTLTWSKVMAWDLRSNLEEEIERAMLSMHIPADRVEQLFPPFPEDHPYIVPGGSATAHATGQAVPARQALQQVRSNVLGAGAALGPPSEGLGSNSWVVSGRMTADGAPLLANDPHLGIQMPSIWYQVGLHCRPVTAACPMDVAGFSFAGVPGVVIGHNARIAWGFTNLGPDTADLFVERTNPDNPDQYELDGEWVDMEMRTEQIEVTGSEPVTLRIRSTVHGPVVSDSYGALDDFGAGGDSEVPEDYAVSLAWTALEPSTLFKALLGLNLATNFDEFRGALEFFDVAAQNVVYADVDGNIGYSATGRIPIRASGDGRYPSRGWDGSQEWVGYIPVDELPYILNPSQGFIVTANQPVVSSAYPYLIGTDHAYGYRASRISELLAGRSGLTVEDMTRMQLDTKDGSAEFIVPVLLGHDAPEPFLEVLEEWSGDDRPYRMDADSAGAAAYAALWRNLLALTFDDELGEDHSAGGNSRYFEAVRRLMSEPGDRWWDDVRTDTTETRDDILAMAASAAYEELREVLGDGGWRWGDLHTAFFVHETLGQSGIGPIEALFNRSAPSEVSGGSAIVNATGWHAPSGYGVLALPSMRMVVDLGDLTRSVAIHTTGQSGHPFSSHYSDMIEPWAIGETNPLLWTISQVEAEESARLTLVPRVSLSE